MVRSPDMAEYSTLRKTCVALNNRLLESLKRDEVVESARSLGLMRPGSRELELDNEDQLCVVMDFAIHSVFRDGINAVTRMLRDKPPVIDSQDAILLRGFEQSHYTILQVRKQIPGIGVEALDGPEELPILLVDRGLSMTATLGMSLATRVLTPNGDWWMTSGAALPMNEGGTTGAYRDLAAFRTRHQREPLNHELECILIRNCLQAGSSHQIGYRNSETLQSRIVRPIRRNKTTVGRNESCPCGSGRKYKKCCG